MKKIISAILAVMMVLSLSLCLFACNNENNGNDGGENGGNQTPQKKTYTVTVVDENGNPVKGAYVSFTAEGANPIPFETDKDGKASRTSDSKITITLLTIPKGYESDKVGSVLTPDADGNVTVTLKKAAVADPYVILVVDEQGNPVAGVTVQMCSLAGSCRVPVVTGEDGKAEYAFEEGEFKVQLTGGMDGVPEGYTIDDPAQNFYFDGKLCTITLTKVN